MVFLSLRVGFAIEHKVGDDACHECVHCEHRNLKVQVTVAQVEVAHNERRVGGVDMIHETAKARKETSLAVVAEKIHVLAHTVNHLLDVVAQQTAHLSHVERLGSLAPTIAVEGDEGRLKAQSIVGQVGEWLQKGGQGVDLHQQTRKEQHRDLGDRSKNARRIHVVHKEG